MIRAIHIAYLRYKLRQKMAMLDVLEQQIKNDQMAEKYILNDAIEIRCRLNDLQPRIKSKVDIDEVEY